MFNFLRPAVPNKNVDSRVFQARHTLPGRGAAAGDQEAPAVMYFAKGPRLTAANDQTYPRSKA